MFIKNVRMAEDAVEIFERACVIVAVGDALIGNNGIVNIFVLFNAAVLLKLKLGTL